MADESAAPAANTETPAPENEKVEAIVRARVNEKNARIRTLETELADVRQKAQGYDSLNQTLAEKTARLAQAEATAGYFRAASPLGMQPEHVEHLANRYAVEQNAVAEDKRTPFGNWLSQAISAPDALDPVSRAVVREHLASRSGPAPGVAMPSQVAPVAPGPAPVAPQAPVAVPPATNNGVMQSPPTVPGMTQDELAALVRDTPRFKQWKKDNPKAWDAMNRRGVG